jgi:hypothetical protein
LFDSRDDVDSPIGYLNSRVDYANDRIDAMENRHG